MASDTNTITLTKTSTPSSLDGDNKSSASSFAINRNEFEQLVAGTLESGVSTVDGSVLQEVGTVISEPAPVPMEQLNVESFVIVWLDANIGQNDSTRKTIEQLRRIANNIRTFTDRAACIEFISQIKNEQVFFIVSGSLGHETVPDVNQFRQIEGIYIFCVNLEKHIQWAKTYRQVLGVFTEIEPLCEQIRRRIQRVTYYLIGFHFMGNSSNNQQEASFMYAQLLKEVLLDMDRNRCHIEEMVNFCRFQYAKNPFELKWISEFERNYIAHSPVWWYSLDTCLHKMLNKALRTQEIETMYALRFFIRHLHTQLVQLSKQFSVDRSIHLYRGQGMFTDEFEKLKANSGGLFSISNFLSTSTDKEAAREFALNSLNDLNRVAVNPPPQ
jgi:hypothetical protein